MNILISGSSGFIGFHLSKLLLEKKNRVIGVDNQNNYYDKNLKIDRNKILLKYKNFKFYKIDLKNKKNLEKVFKTNKIDCVINLAAQAGVRYSLINPQSYIDNNILGFFNILELSKKSKVKKFIYASTSSIYGLQNKFPIKETFNTDNPIQLYAATKKANEVMAAAYSNLYNIKTIGLRFFTVYGPWGRPDMALFKFTKNIIDGKKIKIFNKGNHIRDFTYVDDIVDGVYSLLKKQSKKTIPYQIFNIGNGNPKKLVDYLKHIENNLNRTSKIKKLPLQIGDIVKTHSNIKKLKKYTGYNPKININIGIAKFIEWYKDYYKVN